MKRKEVKSSNIKSIGYDKENNVLEIEFKTGMIYHYHEVPETAYNELINAKSHGIVFNGVIKGKYKFLKGELIVPDLMPLKGIHPVPGIAIVEMLKIIPKNISDLITPGGDMASSKDVDYDVHPVQGVIVALTSMEFPGKSLELKVGDKIAMNSNPDWLTQKGGTKDLFVWNNKAFALVRAYNIICIIKK